MCFIFCVCMCFCVSFYVANQYVITIKWISIYFHQFTIEKNIHPVSLYKLLFTGYPWHRRAVCLFCPRTYNESVCHWYWCMCMCVCLCVSLYLFLFYKYFVPKNGILNSNHIWWCILLVHARGRVCIWICFFAINMTLSYVPLLSLYLTLFLYSCFSWMLSFCHSRCCCCCCYFPYRSAFICFVVNHCVITSASKCDGLIGK